MPDTGPPQIAEERVGRKALTRLSAPANAALTWIVALLAAATLAGFLDRVSWLFESAVFLRLQYAAILLAAALAALALRRLRLAGAAALLAGVNVAVIAPWSGTALADPVPGEPTIRVVAFNVDAANRRFDELGRLVRNVRPDVLGLTELTPEWARAAVRGAGDLSPARLLPRSDAYGMGVLSTLPRLGVRVERLPADGPPTLVTRFSVAGRPVTFVLVHVHTPFAGSVHERELRALAAARPRLGSRLIVCGDFNTVPWSAQFSELLDSTGLSDAFGGSWPVYSWPAWSSLLRMPLDHCLVSEGLAVVGRRFGPSGGSDHFPLIVDVAVTPIAR